MSLSLDEKLGGKEIFSSSHGLLFHCYFTRNWVVFITISQSQTSYLLYHREQQSQDSNSTWIGCTILMEALGTFQNIPLLNFYSITLFLSLVFLTFLLPLPWIFLALWKGLLSLIPLCQAPSMLVKFGMWVLLHSPALRRARAHSPVKMIIKKEY